MDNQEKSLLTKSREALEKGTPDRIASRILLFPALVETAAKMETIKNDTKELKTKIFTASQDLTKFLEHVKNHFHDDKENKAISEVIEQKSTNLLSLISKLCDKLP